MTSPVSQAIEETYVNVLTDRVSRTETKSILVDAFNNLGSSQLITDSDEVLAFYKAVALYVFFVERNVSGLGLDAMHRLLKEGNRAYYSIDDFCFFDNNLSYKPDSFVAKELQKKGNLCLLYGGFFYTHNLGASIAQIRWTGKSSFMKAAELSHSKDVAYIYSDLGERYSMYEEGLRSARDQFF